MKIQYEIPSGEKVLLDFSKIDTGKLVKDYMVTGNRLCYLKQAEDICWEYNNNVNKATRTYDRNLKLASEHKLIKAILDLAIRIFEENGRGLDCFAVDDDIPDELK